MKMVNNDTLRALERGGLLRRSSGGDGREYAFHHVLSQEAAYHSLLKADRARLHGDVASVILALLTGPGGEVSSGDAASESVASLVFHYERAGDDQKLCMWAVRAGEGAHRRFAGREALDYYDRALRAAERLGSDAPQDSARGAFSGRGHILRTTGDPVGALETFRAMQAFGERVEDSGIAIEALNHINTIRIITPDAVANGNLGVLDADLARARSRANDHGDPALCARAVWNAGLRVRFTDVELAAALFGEALAIAASDPDGKRRDLSEITATAAMDLAIIRAVSGHYDLSLALSIQAVAASRLLENGALLADALGNVAMNSRFVGDGEASETAAEEAIAISTAAHNPWGLAYSNWPKIERLIDCGEYAKASGLIAETLPAVHASRMPVFVAFYQAMTCRLARLVGDNDRGLNAAREAEAAFQAMGGESWAIAGLGVGASGALAAGDLSGAGERLTRAWSAARPPALPYQGFNYVAPALGEHALRAGTPAIALPFFDWYVQARERHGAQQFAAEGRYWRGRLNTQVRDGANAKADLAIARAFFERAGEQDHLWRVDAALAALARRMGNADEAVATRARARQTLDDLSSRLVNSEHRLALLRQFEINFDE